MVVDVKQISVFLENKSGRLAEVTKIFGENDIDISALSIADTTDFGILRLIVNDQKRKGIEGKWVYCKFNKCYSYWC